MNISSHSKSSNRAAKQTAVRRVQVRHLAPRRLVSALAGGSLLTLSLSVSLSVWPSQAQAQTLPSGMNVLRGQAQISNKGNAMTVTNTPGAILNWNSFSVGAQNSVRFEQQSAASQVLNRVTGNDPSKILGSLSSNGKVWLINPNGVLFGQNARVDVAGLVTSTLNLNDQDWLNGQASGRYNFSAPAQGPAAELLNQGELRSSLGGRIVLLGGSVRNEGLIEANAGQILLAAGKSIDLVDTGSPNLSVRVTAPQGQALNLGTLAAAGGRIDIHASVVNQQGIARAESLASGAGGEIVMRASEALNLSAGSQTLVDGSSQGGTISVDAGAGTALISGKLSALGQQGLGGQIELLGRQIGLKDAAHVDASGRSGGGEVFVGGGLQGQDKRFVNAEAVFFGQGASISADAKEAGDGGRIILWSDKATRAFGSLSARGGRLSGNGGFIETSGGWLDARPASVRADAAQGKAGVWLLDPSDITISNEANTTPSDFWETVFSNPSEPNSNLNIATLQTALANNNVLVDASTGAGNGSGSITVLNGITWSGDHSLTLNAKKDITISSGAPITVKGGFGGGGLNLHANGDVRLNALVSLENGAFTVRGLDGGASRAASFTAGDEGQIFTYGRRNGNGPDVSIATTGDIASSNISSTGGPSVNGSGLNGGLIALDSRGGAVTIRGTLTSLGSAAQDFDPANNWAGGSGGRVDLYAGKGVRIEGGVRSIGGAGYGNGPSGSGGRLYLQAVGPVSQVGAIEADSLLLSNTSGPTDLSNSTNRILKLGSIDATEQSFSFRNDAPITQVGPIKAAKASFDAGSHAITLTHAGNVFTDAVSLKNSGAHDVRVRNSGGILLDDASVGQNLEVTTDGSISQIGALTVPGTSTFTVDGVRNRNVALATGNNDLTGLVTINAVNGGSLYDVEIRNISDRASLSALPASLHSLFIVYPNASVVVPQISLSGDLILTAGRDITVERGSRIEDLDGQLSVELNAGGRGQGGILLDGVSIKTGGGPIYLGGPTQVNGQVGSAIGHDGRGAAINIVDSNLNAGSGRLTARGLGTASIGNSFGLLSANSTFKASDIELLGTVNPVGNLDTRELTGIKLDRGVLSADHALSAVGTVNGANGNIRGLEVSNSTLYVSGVPGDTSARLSLSGHSLSDAISALAIGNSKLDASNGAAINILGSSGASGTAVSLAAGDPDNWIGNQWTGSIDIWATQGGLSLYNIKLVSAGPIGLRADTSLLDFKRSALWGRGTVTLAGEAIEVSDALISSNSSVDLRASTSIKVDLSNIVPVDPAGQMALSVDAGGALSVRDSGLESGGSDIALKGGAVLINLGSSILAGQGRISVLGRKLGKGVAVDIDATRLSGRDVEITGQAPADFDSGDASVGVRIGGGSRLTASHSLRIEGTGGSAGVTLNNATLELSPADGDTSATGVHLTGKSLGTSLSSGTGLELTNVNVYAGQGAPISIKGDSAGKDGGGISVLGGGEGGTTILGSKPIGDGAFDPAGDILIETLQGKLQLQDVAVLSDASIRVWAPDVYLGGSTRLESSGVKGGQADAIIVAGSATGRGMNRFVNNTGGSPLIAKSTDAAPNQRWLVIGSDPQQDFFAGALNYDFKQYGYQLDTAAAQSNNGLLFTKPQELRLKSDPISKVYDGKSSVELSNLVVDSGLVDGDKVTQVLTPFAYFDNPNAGVGKSVVLEALGVFSDANDKRVYGYTWGGLQGNIDKAWLTVTPEFQRRKYGEANPVFSQTISGFVNGETSAVVSGTASGSSEANAFTSAGTALIFGSTAGLSAQNYEFVTSIGTMLIDKALLTVTAMDQSRKYGGANPVFSQTLSGFVNGETSAVVGGSAFGSSEANVLTGVGKAVIKASSAGLISGNYEFATVDGTLSIEKAPLTVTANNQTRRYGELNPVFTQSITGFVNNETSAVVSGSALGLSAATVSSGVGTAEIVGNISGLTAANYDFTSANGTLTITKAPLTITAVAARKTYDGKAYAGGNGVTFSGFVNNETGSVLDGTLVFAGSSQGARNAGRFVITPQGLTGVNYAINYVDAGLTIEPATISAITGITAQNKTYDRNTDAKLDSTGAVFSGMVAGDQLNVAAAQGSFVDKNVGSAKTVNISNISLGGSDAGNYTLASNVASTQADITPMNLSLGGLTANNRIYDGGVAATLSGSPGVSPIAGDQVTVTPGVANFGDKNVGNGKQVLLSGFGLGGADAGNYVLTSPTFLSASISPAVLQYLASPVSMGLGEALPPLPGVVLGFVGGDTQQNSVSGTLTFSTNISAQAPAGSYAVQGGGLQALNYTFVQAPSNTLALTVAGLSPAKALSQTVSTALNTAVKVGEALPTNASSGLLDMMQAPAAGIESTAVLASTAAPSASASAGSKSFGQVSLGSLSPIALADLLNSRDRYKKTLFADAINQLEQDPSLADLHVCRTLAEVDSGNCVISEELKQQLLAAKRDAESQAKAPSVEAAAVVARSVALPDPRKVKTAALPQIVRKVAVVIGIDDYADPSIPTLSNAVKDAKAIGALFEGTLGYETLVMPNASKQAVVGTLNRLALELGPKDSVVVYYAGHGELVEATGQGYWQLADSDAKRPETWLSNADINRMIAQIGSSQVALISDSCYSGSLVSSERIRATPASSDPSALLARKAVVVMSSGGNEPVFDEGKNGHSPFAWNLMQSLKQVKNWQAGGNVFERVRFAVAKELPQRPLYSASSAAGHQSGGDYLFEQRQLEASN